MKPENILLEPDLNYETMKIIDFGTAIPFDKKRNKKMTEMLGTPYYIAPEVLEGLYNEKCDIWSIGVITFMLLSGKAPFYGDTDDKIYRMVKAGEVKFGHSSWKQVSPEAMAFIQTLLTTNFNKRPSAAEALDLPWIKMGKETIDSVLAVEVLGNLGAFRASAVLKRATLTYMASQLVSKQEKEKLASLFKQIDKNKDGRLDK